MPTSVLVNSRLRYPDPEASYSPSERYPEYPFPAIAERPNDVYAHLRRTLLQLELDKARIGTPEWNPLGDFISRGSSVFVLCNFVYHRRARESAAKFAAKCIHGSVLRALCDYVLIAVGPEGRVQFGNAPLQYCRWERVFEETGASHVAEFYRRERAPVTPKDLRLLSADRSALGRVHEVQTGDDRDAVEVSLGSESLLAPIAGDGNHRARFRIADYKPERIEAFHAGSRHRYVIHRDVLESDVVIS
ncbi:MAG: hypothetical protein P8Y95_16505, partial [Gammaproteobacteria bacterium]